MIMHTVLYQTCGAAELANGHLGSVGYLLVNITGCRLQCLSSHLDSHILSPTVLRGVRASDMPRGRRLQHYQPLSATPASQDHQRVVEVNHSPRPTSAHGELLGPQTLAWRHGISSTMPTLVKSGPSRACPAQTSVSQAAETLYPPCLTSSRPSSTTMSTTTRSILCTSRREESISARRQVVAHQSR